MKKKSSQNNPKISIIVPVYNAEKYLDRCLTALINQTFKEIEILCINDGSTDGSLEILNRYQQLDSRVRVFSQKNSGPAKARNVGLKNMRGKYLMFCDADDWYEKIMCEEMYQTICKQNTSLIMCDCKIWDFGFQHKRDNGTINYHHLKFNGFKYLSTQVKLDINVLLWNKIFRTDIVKRYNILFPEGYECDDNSFCHQYLCASETCFTLNQELYNYVLYENSIMGRWFNKKSSKNKLDRIFTTRYTIGQIKKNNLLNSNLNFILRRLQMDVSFLWPYLTFKEKYRAICLWKDILSDIPKAKDYCSLFRRMYVRPTFWAVLKVSYGLLKFYEIPFKFGFITLKRNKTSCSFALWNFKIYEKSKNSTGERVSVFGVAFFRKLNIASQSNKKELYKIMQENNKSNIMLMHQQLTNKPRPYVVLFDCLYDKDAEAIDAFSLFQELKHRGIQCIYFLLKDNKLYKTLNLYQHPQIDIITLQSSSELLSFYQVELAKATHIITSFGLQLTPYENKILHDLPYCEYIFIDHGIIYLKEWVCKMYSPQFFNKILVASPFTKHIYKQQKIWQDTDMICCDMPRWKALQREPHRSKTIFIFFTWRKSFEFSQENFNKYQERIIDFLYDEKWNTWLKNQKITVKLGVHHSLLFNKRILRLSDRIDIVPCSEISKAIRQADLLITDYSSIFIDFMRLNIPIIFYLFDSDVDYSDDLDNQTAQQAKEKLMKIYNACYEKEQVFDKVQFYYNNNFKLEDSKKKINETFFWKDSPNLCEYITRGEN